MTQAPITGAAPAPRKRRRGRVALVVTAIIVVLLVVAGIVLDNVARAQAAKLIETKVRSSLSLPESTPVDVTVRGTSMLFQLVTGKLERVDIDIDDLSVGALSGDAKATATGIPLDQDKPIDRARLVFSTDQAGLQKLVGSVPNLPASSVVVRKGAVELGTTFTVFGVAIPLAVTFVPSAADGQLVLTPRSIELGGKAVDADDLQKSLGAVGAELASSKKICVATLLPKDFRLDSIEVKGSRVQLGVSAASVTLNDGLLSTKGTCPAT